MEKVVLTVLFIVPGLIGKLLRDSFIKERRIYSNHYEYLSHIVIDSIVVNALIIWIMSTKNEIATWSEFVAYMQSFANCISYIFIMLPFTIAWTVLKNTLLSKGYVYVKNKLLKRKYHEHSLHTTDWDTMLNEVGVKGTWQVMSIYKDDKYITSGMRHSSQTTNGKEFEIRLDRVAATERMRRTHPELFHIKYEYYNVSNGLRVIFYEQKELEEHWENKI